MLIKRKSEVSGETRSLDLNITPEQVKSYLKGALIQDAFPDLSADDREFIMTGIVPEEWDKLFGE